MVSRPDLFGPGKEKGLFAIVSVDMAVEKGAVAFAAEFVAVIVIEIHRHPEGEVLQIAFTRRSHGKVFGFIQGGHQDRQQNGNHRDNDK